MIFNGYKGLTLLDYPEKTAALVYTGGCNFRCPFCHNAVLVEDPKSQPVITEEEVLEKLAKRKGMLDGLVITGGEPTLHGDLPEFCRKVKELGFLVKLDTNGTNPEMVRSLIGQGLVDYVAMDVKSAFTPRRYSLATGIPMDKIQPLLDKIIETRNLLLAAGADPFPRVEYEFRTTVVSGIHTYSDFIDIAAEFRHRDIEHPGHRVRNYYLQAYRNSDGQIDPTGLCVPSREFLNTCMENLSCDIPSVRIRGEE